MLIIICMFMCQHKSKKNLKMYNIFNVSLQKDPKYFESFIEHV